MRFLVLAAAIWIGAVPLARAQPAPIDETMQAALDLQQAMGGVEATRRALQAIQPQMVRQLMQTSHMPIGEASERIAQLMPDIEKHVPELLQAKARSFAKYLTLRDLQAMTAFYRSDAARDLLAHQAAIASDSMAAMQPMIRDLMAKAKALAEQSQKQGAAPTSP